MNKTKQKFQRIKKLNQDILHFWLSLTFQPSDCLELEENQMYVLRFLTQLGSNIDLLCFLLHPRHLMKQSWISINPDYCQFQMTELALFYGTKTLILSLFTALMPGTWTRNIGPKTQILGLGHFFVTRPIPLNWLFQVSPWKMPDPTNAELISNLVKPLPMKLTWSKSEGNHHHS